MNHVFIKRELKICLEYFEKQNLPEYANRLKRIINTLNGNQLLNAPHSTKDGFIDCQGIHLNSDKGKIS